MWIFKCNFLFFFEASLKIDKLLDIIIYLEHLETQLLINYQTNPNSIYVNSWVSRLVTMKRVDPKNGIVQPGMLCSGDDPKSSHLRGTLESHMQGVITMCATSHGVIPAGSKEKKAAQIT